jgi:hypothetical protein
MEDDPDFTALAADAERKAGVAESLHLAALWRELAATYRELAGYHRRRHELTSSDESPDSEARASDRSQSTP